MIDWITFRIPYHGTPFGSTILEMDHETGEVIPKYEKAKQIEGSWSSKLSMQVQGRELTVSGNPVKFLTGQNVFGPSCLKTLITLTLKKIFEIKKIDQCPVMLNCLELGSVEITRVDCTYHYNVGTNADVGVWLEAMASHSHVKYRGRGHFSHSMGSLMYGLSIKDGERPKGSKVSSFKFYNKLQEMTKFPPTCFANFAEICKEYVTGKVRAEACYRSLELKKLGKKSLRNWTENTCFELHKHWIEKIDITENVTLNNRQEINLPEKHKLAYRAWAAGEDLRSLMTKSTFYRKRREMLEFKIDIATMRDTEATLQVVPVLSVISANHCDDENNDHKMFFEMLEAA